MNEVQSRLAAENLAGVIYTRTEQAYMAHTVRAVESYITEEYGKDYFPITVKVEKGVRARWQSKSWVIVTDSHAFILVDSELDRDQTRVCIAHECYHIVESFRPVKSHHHTIEFSCDAFANTLCAKHNLFYNDQSKVNGCKFPRLPINARRG